MSHTVIFDSNHADHGDLIDLKLSPYEAYRLALNLLQGCQHSVQKGDNDYTVLVSFTGRVVKSRP
jgi:hypothetical protein